MKFIFPKHKNLILLLIGPLIALCFFYFIFFIRRVNNKVYELPDNFSEASLDFAYSLRMNDPIAYQISDEKLWPKIDEWMATHMVQDCKSYPDDLFGGGGIQTAKGNFFTDLIECTLRTGERYTFNVYSIEIEEREGEFIIVDWGEVEETIEP